MTLVTHSKSTNVALQFKKIAFTVAVSLLALSTTQVSAADPMPQPTENLALDAKALSSLVIPSDELLISVLGRDYTAGEFTNIIRYTPPSPFGRINSIEFSLDDFSADIVRNAIEEFAQQQAAFEQFESLGLEPNQNEKEALESQRDRLLQLVWLENQGILSPLTVTDEQLQAEYDVLKDAQFQVEETLELRHIFISAYEEYTVVEGDSLESIAEKISGDAKLAEFILNYDLPRRPRNQPTVDGEGKESPAKALTPDEILLVPLNAEKKEALRLKAEEAYNRLSLGEDFVTLAKEFGDNSSKGEAVKLQPEKSERPLLPEFVQAFHEIADGEYSKPFETKHGFQILQRVSYTPKGYTPLENVKTELKTRVETIQRNELYKKVMEKLWAEYDQVQINQEVLNVAEKPESENEVIFTIDDFKYLGSMFKRDFESKLTPETTPVERRALLAAVPIVGRTITKWDIERKKLEETEIYLQRLDLLSASIYFSTYKRYFQNELHPFAPTEADFQRKFEELKTQLANMPVVEVWQIMVSPKTPVDITTQEGTNELNKLREEVAATLKEKVTDVASFEELAKVLSEHESAAQGGKLGKVNQFFMDGLGGEFLLPGKENSLMGPYSREDKILAFWIGENSKEEAPTLDAVRDGLRKELEREHQSQIADLLKSELLKASKLEIKAPQLIAK